MNADPQRRAAEDERRAFTLAGLLVGGVVTWNFAVGHYTADALGVGLVFGATVMLAGQLIGRLGGPAERAVQVGVAVVMAVGIGVLAQRTGGVRSAAFHVLWGLPLVLTLLAPRSLGVCAAGTAAGLLVGITLLLMDQELGLAAECAFYTLTSGAFALARVTSAQRSHAHELEAHARIQRTLRTDQERLSVLLGCADGMVFEMTPEGTLVNVWTRRADWLPAPTELLVGRPLRELLGEAGAQKFIDRGRKALLGGREVVEHSFEVNGTVHWFEAKAALPPVYEGRRTVAFLLREITARRQVQTELQTRVHQQAEIARLGRLVNAGTSFDVLAGAVVQAVVEHLRVDRCELLERTPGGFALRAGHGWGGDLVGSQLAGEGEPLAARAFLSTEPLFAGERRGELGDRLEKQGVVAALAQAVDGMGPPLGVLLAYSRRARCFSREDAHFLEAIAHVLARGALKKRVEECQRRGQDERDAAVKAAGVAAAPGGGLEPSTPQAGSDFNIQPTIL